MEKEDKLLINKLKEGDFVSFDNIFKKFNKKVYFFAQSYLKNKEESEDVVQEVFMNLWKYRDQINESYVFNKYLFKITYNSTCKHLRKKASDRKHVEEVIKIMCNEDNSTIAEIEFDNLSEIAIQIIQKLPSRQRDILLLNIEQNLSIDQIAEKLKISTKTVKNYLTMARTSLRKTFISAGIFSSLFICLFLS